MRILVDTNVLLDVLAKREPYYEDSATIWSLAEVGQIEAYVSAISFNNVFYIVRKLEGVEKAFEAMKILRDLFMPVAPDAQIINQAIDAKMKDFEDAIQYVSAIRAQVDFLVTRNPDDFPHEPIVICSPAEFLALHESEADSA